MDATSLSFALDGDLPNNSLKPTDFEVLQDTIDDLKGTLNARKLESSNMIAKIRRICRRLSIKSNLSLVNDSGEENLYSVNNLALLRNELSRVEDSKTMNVEELIKVINQELKVLWVKCMVDEAEQAKLTSQFCNEERGNVCELLEDEVSRLQCYYDDNKPILSKVLEFSEICNLAVDLRKRMDDPLRLTSRRGGLEVLNEEKDRKRVDSVVVLKEELLKLVDMYGRVLIKNRHVIEFIEEEFSKIAELFPSSLNRSSSKGNESCLSATFSKSKSFNQSKSNVSKVNSTKTTMGKTSSVAMRSKRRNSINCRPKLQGVGIRKNHIKRNSFSKKRNILKQIIPAIQLNDETYVSVDNAKFMDETVAENEFAANVQLNSTIKQFGTGLSMVAECRWMKPKI